MIGLDSNVIIRYVAQDDATQTPIATRIFESCSFDNPGFISLVALVETVWVLRSSYETSHQQIHRVVETLLRTRGIVVEQSELVWMALAEFALGTADLGDYLIECCGRAAGCEYTLTFDRDAASSPGMKLLK